MYVPNDERIGDVRGGEGAEQHPVFSFDYRQRDNTFDARIHRPMSILHPFYEDATTGRAEKGYCGLYTVCAPTASSAYLAANNAPHDNSFRIVAKL